MSFDELMHPFLLGIFLEMEFLVCVYPMLEDAANSSPKWLHQFILILAMQKNSSLCHFALSFCNPLSWVTFSYHHCDYLKVFCEGISLEKGVFWNCLSYSLK